MSVSCCPPCSASPLCHDEEAIPFVSKTELGFDLQGKRLRGVLGVGGAECGRHMGAGGASTSLMLAPHPSPATQSRALRRPRRTMPSSTMWTNWTGSWSGPPRAPQGRSCDGTVMKVNASCDHVAPAACEYPAPPKPPPSPVVGRHSPPQPWSRGEEGEAEGVRRSWKAASSPIVPLSPTWLSLHPSAPTAISTCSLQTWAAWAS